MLRFLISIFMFLIFATASHAQSTIAIDSAIPTTNITSRGQHITAEKPDIAVEIPGDTANAPKVFNLQSQNNKNTHLWSIYNFTNEQSETRAAILVLDHQNFVGSRIFNLKSFDPVVMQLVTSDSAAQVVMLPAFANDVFQISIPGKSKLSIALETTEPAPAISLWQPQAYTNTVAQDSAIIGGILAAAILMALMIFALNGLRSFGATLAGGLFAFASLVFIALELGLFAYLFQINGITPPQPIVIRSLVEGIMTSALFFCVYELCDAAKLNPKRAMIILGAAILSLASPALSFIDPALAISLSRCLFAAAAIMGFALANTVEKDTDTVSRSNIYFWSSLMVWVTLAFSAALWKNQEWSMAFWLCLGLVIVMGFLANFLVRTVYGQTYLTRRFFSDAGRRSLALTAAHQHIWDWSPREQLLVIGSELWIALGYTVPTATNNLRSFTSIMHPADLPHYLNQTDKIENASKGFISLSCRLRHAAGQYMWFNLRATTIIGEGEKISRTIGTLSDITEAKQTELQLLTSSLHDVVTGLPNRALFEDRLRQALAQKFGIGLQVFLIELENFKNLNEALGHDVGDNLLAATGRRITAALAKSDTVGRIAGDQFAVIFVSPDGARNAAQFAEILTTAISAPLQLAGHEIVLVSTIGITPSADEEASAEQLLKEAAIALYEAKRNGEQRVLQFVKSMRDEREAEIILASELRRAIDRREFEVLYQPIAQLKTMELVGFEALVRWRHPRLGLLLPDAFIALAEQTGMIGAVGQFVLFESGRQLGIWQRMRRVGQPIFMAVNVSAAQLIDGNLCDDVSAVLVQEAMSPETLKIEITESIVMQFPERASIILQQLSALGVGLSCDDFGTGHSSLASLRDLPFTTLKIDKSFILPKVDSQRADDILAAIIGLAHQLGMDVVAEGIETEQQLAALGYLDCNFGQGFLIGEPLTPTQVSDALGNSVIKPNSPTTAYELNAAPVIAAAEEVLPVPNISG